MSSPLLPVDVETLTLDTETAREAARKHAEAYQAALPYPHICIDNFLTAPPYQWVRGDPRNREREQGETAELSALGRRLLGLDRWD